MKKLLCIALICILTCLLTGCSSPNSLRMDLSQGYGKGITLIHLNASSSKKQERIGAFLQALADAEPLEKSLSMFAYYPDYRLEFSGKTLVSSGRSSGFEITDAPGSKDATLTAIVDVNGDFVDFYFPGPEPAQSDVIYRSKLTAQEFKKLVNQV